MKNRIFIYTFLVPLQKIFIEGVNLDKPNKKKPESQQNKISKTMLPQELAEIVLGGISTDPGVLNYELLENNPVEIDGQSGFRAVYLDKNKDGLQYRNIYYGFIHKNWYYRILYSAPLRYYFYKDVETYEHIVESFKLIKK